MKKPVIFLGESQQIIEIRETCDIMGLQVAGIIDDDYYGNTTDFDGIPYIGSERTADWSALKRDYDFFIPINPVPTLTRNVSKRKNFIQLVDQHDLPCVNIVDPNTRISPRSQLGKGIYVAYSAYIAPHVTIGDHCQIHFNVGIMHNVVIGRNTMLNRISGVMSNITIGDNVYLGGWAKLMKQHSHIGSDSFIHPGVMVHRDVEPGETVNITGRKIYSMLADLGNTEERQ